MAPSLTQANSTLASATYANSTHDLGQPNSNWPDSDKQGPSRTGNWPNLGLNRINTDKSNWPKTKCTGRRGKQRDVLLVRIFRSLPPKWDAVPTRKRKVAHRTSAQTAANAHHWETHQTTNHRIPGHEVKNADTIHKHDGASWTGFREKHTRTLIWSSRRAGTVQLHP